MSGAANGPQVVTVYGRLSFPTWTAAAQYERSQKGQYPAKSPADAAPDFQLLLEDAQFQKLKAKIVDEFFPFCIQQDKDDAKSNKLNAAEVKALTAQIAPPWDGPLNMPFKPVHEKTAELAPEAVVAIKVIGNKGVDFEQKAIVRKEGDLLIPDPDILKYPTIVPLDDTKFSMYAGCYVTVTLNLYAYHNGKPAGFSAGASVAVFREDGDRFGGGVAVDEEEMFLD